MKLNTEETLVYWEGQVQLNWRPDLKYLEYEKFLATEYWKSVRCLVMLRCGAVCEKCRKNKATEVHHLSYSIKGYEHQNLHQLMALCSNCHRKKHKRQHLKDNGQKMKTKKTKAPRIEPRRERRRRP